MGTYRNQIRIWKACSSVSWMGRRCWIHECLCHLFRMIYTRCQWYWKFMDSMTLLNFNGAYFYIYISGMNLCINILAFRFQNKWLRSVSVRGFFSESIQHSETFSYVQSKQTFVRSHISNLHSQFIHRFILVYIPHAIVVFFIHRLSE